MMATHSATGCSFDSFCHETARPPSPALDLIEILLGRAELLGNIRSIGDLKMFIHSAAHDSTAIAHSSIALHLPGLIATLFNADMADKDLAPEQLAAVQAYRTENLKSLVGRFGSNVATASALGLSVGHVSQMKNGTRKMGEAVARRIEGALDLHHLAMDEPRLVVDEAIAKRIEARKLAEDWLSLPEGFRAEVRKFVDGLLAALVTVPQLRNHSPDSRVGQYLKPAPSTPPLPAPEGQRPMVTSKHGIAGRMSRKGKGGAK